MPRPHGNCKFRNEWLAIDKFKDWVARDRADDKTSHKPQQGGEMYAVTLCVYENGANRKLRKTCHGKAMCDRLNTKYVNGPRVVLWLTCWRRKVE